MFKAHVHSQGGPEHWKQWESCRSRYRVKFSIILNLRHVQAKIVDEKTKPRDNVPEGNGRFD